MRTDLAFSLDSKHIAYVVKAENQQLVVVDGIDGKPYDEILSNVKTTENSFQYVSRKANNIYFVEEVF